MDPEVWKRVKAALVAFEELPENKQSAFLEGLKAEDSACYEELVPLLEVEEASLGFLDQPLFQLSDEIEESTPFAVGEMLGPYRLVKRLGSGGMGTVYMAQSEDDQGGPPVAVKVLKRGLDADELRHRFNKERRILGYLNHPNIAKLQDYGMTHDGRPYLVMEFVEGEHITTYCDRHRLSIRERLKIFQRICAAVQYAHQNLIIHRDLKPANILVTPYGEPKLLDFGIAKLMDPEGTKTPVTQTLLNLRPMTPDYASPEQVRGAATDTTCDIYALGVVLYELLTGRRPYRLQGLSDDERTRIICEVIPDRPSTVVSQPLKDADDDFFQDPAKVAEARGSEPKRLSRRLRGDVDTIVDKALRKESDRRYASAEQFSADIERHLQGFPLRARPESSIYASKKYIRRHGWLVAGVITTLLVLLAFSAVVSRQNLRLKHQRDMAEQESERATLMFDSFQHILERASGAQDGTENAYILQALSQIKQRTEGRQLNDREKAAKWQAFGMGYAAIGQQEEAQNLLEEALRLHRRAFSEKSRALSFSMQTLARFYLKTGQYDQALSRFEEVLKLVQTHTGESSWETGEVFCLMAQAEDGLGAFKEAESHYATAFEILRPHKLGHFSLWVQVKTAYAHHFLLRKRSDKAKAIHEAMLEEMEQRLGSQDLALVPSLEILAHIEHDQADYAAALMILNRADSIVKSVQGEALEIRGILEQRCEIYRAQGAWDLVEATAREALQLKRLSKEQSFQWREALAVALAKQTRYMEAEGHLREALHALPGRASVAHARLNILLAGVLIQKGDIEEAKATLWDTEKDLKVLEPHAQIHLIAIQREQAWLASEEGRFEDAEALIKTAMILLAEQESEKAAEMPVERAWNQWVASYVYESAGKLEQAKKAIAKCLELRLAYFKNPNHWQVREAQRMNDRVMVD